MGDAFFVTVQSLSKSASTIRNYKYKEDAFAEWLKTNCPDCMNGNIVAFERITAVNLCNFLSKVSINFKNGAMLSSSTPTGVVRYVAHRRSPTQVNGVL